ncbi:peptidase m48 ste24p [Lasius niger]|uniref:Peptidase m48 ste24p n=1 Tax=Lasius niger TaxID=67767 RepID=A0A0J7NSH5_LASNI|nr:peptidase m48 ste24p [Lasius niger]
MPKPIYPPRKAHSEWRLQDAYDWHFVLTYLKDWMREDFIGELGVPGISPPLPLTTQPIRRRRGRGYDRPMEQPDAEQHPYCFHWHGSHNTS